MDAICKHPFTGEITQVPTEMIGAFVPYTPGLLLEEAAAVAIARDENNAANLMASIFDTHAISEGVQVDHPAIESPSLR